MHESSGADRFAGRTVVVTGAAEGLGKGIAIGFAREGARVAIIDVKADVGEMTAQEVRAETGADVCFVECDVTDEATIMAGVTRIARELSPPSILVNNAAVFVLRGIDASVEEWQRSLSVNVMGPALVTKHVVPHMRAQGGGAIVNIGSISAVIAQREFVTYSAAKAAIPAMTRCLALDLAAAGIRVNCVNPGAVWSATVQRMAAERTLTRDEAAAQENLGREQIQQRIADVEEIGAAVLFLASDAASFITGASLMVDGGWSVR